MSSGLFSSRKQRDQEERLSLEPLKQQEVEEGSLSSSLESLELSSSMNEPGLVYKPVDVANPRNHSSANNDSKIRGSDVNIVRRQKTPKEYVIIVFLYVVGMFAMIFNLLMLFSITFIMILDDIAIQPPYNWIVGLLYVVFDFTLTSGSIWYYYHTVNETIPRPKALWPVLITLSVIAVVLTDAFIAKTGVLYNETERKMLEEHKIPVGGLVFTCLKLGLDTLFIVTFFWFILWSKRGALGRHKRKKMQFI